MRAARPRFPRGSTFVFEPGEPHQIRNTGKDDMLYLILANNPPTDLIHYPDTDQYLAKPPGKVFTMKEAEYYEQDD